MDIRKIKKLIELVEESGIAELEITEGEESVRIHRGSSQAAAPVHYAAPAPIAPNGRRLSRPDVGGETEHRRPSLPCQARRRPPLARLPYEARKRG